MYVQEQIIIPIINKLKLKLSVLDNNEGNKCRTKRKSNKSKKGDFLHIMPATSATRQRKCTPHIRSGKERIAGVFDGFREVPIENRCLVILLEVMVPLFCWFSPEKILKDFLLLDAKR